MEWQPKGHEGAQAADCDRSREHCLPVAIDPSRPAPDAAHLENSLIERIALKPPRTKVLQTIHRELS
jgi:hypothetical protein